MDYMLAEITHLIRNLLSIDAFIDELDPQLRVERTNVVSIKQRQYESWLKELDSLMDQHREGPEVALREDILAALRRAKTALNDGGPGPYTFSGMASHLTGLWSDLLRARLILEEISFRIALASRNIPDSEWQTGEHLKERNIREEQVRKTFSINLFDEPGYLHLLSD